MLMLSSVFGMAGCDTAVNNLSEMVIENSPDLVFPPGFLFKVGGLSVPIEGFDECPGNDRAMSLLFGPAPNQGENSCIIIRKDKSKIPVKVYLRSGMITEEWTIVRKSGKMENGRPYLWTTLHRPDGSAVVPAK